MVNDDISLRTTIAPWLTVEDAAAALSFYKAAFNAMETYRLDTPDGGMVIKLSVNGAEFWLSGGGPEEGTPHRDNIGGDTIRMILTVHNPDILFSQALEAGAKEVFPISEDYGWRLGRLVDPFGLHWEIGHSLSS